MEYECNALIITPSRENMLSFHLNPRIASIKGILELKHTFYNLRIIIYQMRNNNSEVNYN